MTDIEEEEFERLSHPPEAPTTISASTFKQPIEKLFSKKAICVDVSATVGDAVELMRKYEFGAVVVTRNGRLAGIITERDLLTKIVGVVENFQELPVTEAMTHDPISLQKEDAIVYVMHNMQVGGYRHVPIVDEDDVPVSVVSIKDVVRYILSFFQKEVMNITNEPYRGPAVRESG